MYKRQELHINLTDDMLAVEDTPFINHGRYWSLRDMLAPEKMLHVNHVMRQRVLNAVGQQGTPLYQVGPVGRLCAVNHAHKRKLTNARTPALSIVQYARAIRLFVDGRPTDRSINRRSRTSHDSFAICATRSIDR